MESSTNYKTYLTSIVSGLFALILISAATLTFASELNMFPISSNHALMLIGHTEDRVGNITWMFKDSLYLPPPAYYNQFYNISSFPPEDGSERYYVQAPYYDTTPSLYEIPCNDNDGDGYCYWGVSDTKPGNCPASCALHAVPDLDDADPSIHSMYDEPCIDNDGDGYGYPGVDSCTNGPETDCNDADATVYPYATELCDGKDNDCDTVLPAGEDDTDNDGYMACTTCSIDTIGCIDCVTLCEDCDDNNEYVNPGRTELCNGIDDNCINGIDETGDALCDDGNVCNGAETCNPETGCLPGASLDCNDSNACTVDTCDPATGCVNTPNDALCDDSDPHTIDKCDPETGCIYLHPADVNEDFRIELSEAIAYLAGWQGGSNPIAYAIRAAYLWQNGEHYTYDAEQAPPLCWVLAP